MNIAKFIAGALPFDRLYVYGRNRLLRVSIGPEDARVIIEMRESGGRLIPRALRPTELMQRES